MDRIADLLQRLLPALLRIGLVTFVVLVVLELLIAAGMATLSLLDTPGALILIGIFWWWKRKGKGLL